MRQMCFNMFDLFLADSSHPSSAIRFGDSSTYVAKALDSQHATINGAGCADTWAMNVVLVQRMKPNYQLVHPFEERRENNNENHSENCMKICIFMHFTNLSPEIAVNKIQSMHFHVF